MFILELPAELLQLTIDFAVQHIGLERAIRLRETCRQFDKVVKHSIFRLPKAMLLQRKLGLLMLRDLVHSKMLLGNADDLLLCYTINRTADYLTEFDMSASRGRYVEVLETSAARTVMYWRLLDCLTTEKQRCVQLEDIRDNALIAAVGTKETGTVRRLLKEGANPASNTSFFGEALAMAALSGSLAMVQILLDHWDWETYEQLIGLRLMNAIEAAAAAGHESVLAKLLDHKDRIARSTYDDVIIRMVKRRQTSAVEHLLVLRQRDPTPEAKMEFWLRFVRATAEYGQQTLLQRILAEYLPDIGEASLVTAMKDACLENHGQMLVTILPYLSISDPTRHADSIFWTAWFGNLEVLQCLLAFVQNDRRALLIAAAGAVSGKAPEAILYLLNIAGVRSTSTDVPTRFTDIARLMLPDTTSCVMTEPAEPLSVSVKSQNLRAAVRAGKLAEVVNIFNDYRAHHPGDRFVGISGAFSDAAKYNRLDILRFLCENWRIYRFISCVKSPAVAQIFIDFGWDVGQPDEYPLLGRFVYDEHFSRWLLRKGASADARGGFNMNSVSTAIQRASMSTVRLLLDYSSGIQRGQLLHFAVQRWGDGSLEIIELLLNLGCPIDSIWFQNDERSWIEWRLGEAGTALFTAAERGRDDIVSYLLSRGANATILSNKNRTALDVAESRQRLGTVRLLSQ